MSGYCEEKKKCAKWAQTHSLDGYNESRRMYNELITEHLI